MSAMGDGLAQPMVAAAAQGCQGLAEHAVSPPIVLAAKICWRLDEQRPWTSRGWRNSGWVDWNQDHHR